MILHKLILHHARHGPDHQFYALQTEDAIRWLQGNGAEIAQGVSVLDLGCGTGVFGSALMRRGCSVTFADEKYWLSPDIPAEFFRAFTIGLGDLATLGTYDLVICSNVLEHLPAPQPFITSMRSTLKPGGWFYLSWTNWYSPWGGHDFSPFHYFGPILGPRLFDRLVKRPRILKPFENLFPTHIGPTLRALKQESGLEIVRIAPRYYTELWPVMKLPLIREFLAWNCAILLRRPD